MWNSQNPAVRRILADVRELGRDASDQYAAKPLEENMFEWHFAIRGPVGTDYEGGVYHGRIVLPKDYPFKPPSIMLLTPNGRWEVKEKICLSISDYHPEQWQPAWGIRTILEAIISFMAAPGKGAIGAIECSPELRRALARKSQTYKHPLMPELPPLNTTTTSEETKNKYAEQVKQLHVHKIKRKPDDTKQQNGIDKKVENLESSEQEDSGVPKETKVGDGVETAVENVEESTGSAPPATSGGVVVNETGQRANNAQGDSVDRMLHHLSIALMMAIFAILYRKALQLYA